MIFLIYTTGTSAFCSAPLERLREFWADIVSAASVVVGSNKTIQYMSNIFNIQSFPKTVGLHTATATSCDDLDHHWIGWSQEIGLDMKWIPLLKCRWRTIFVSGLMEPPLFETNAQVSIGDRSAVDQLIYIWIKHHSRCGVYNNAKILGINQIPIDTLYSDRLASSVTHFLVR